MRTGRQRGTVGAGHESELSRLSLATAFKVFHETRITAFMLFTNHETRITAFTSRASDAGRVEMQVRLPRPQPSHCLPAHYFPVLPTISRQKILHLCQCRRAVRRSRSASRRAPFTAAPVDLRAGPATVDANWRTAPASAAKTPLIRVGSCPFAVNEPCWELTSMSEETEFSSFDDKLEA